MVSGPSASFDADAAFRELDALRERLEGHLERLGQALRTETPGPEDIRPHQPPRSAWRGRLRLLGALALPGAVLALGIPLGLVRGVLLLGGIVLMGLWYVLSERADPEPARDEGSAAPGWGWSWFGVMMPTAIAAASAAGFDEDYSRPLALALMVASMAAAGMLLADAGWLLTRRVPPWALPGAEMIQLSPLPPASPPVPVLCRIRQGRSKFLAVGVYAAPSFYALIPESRAHRDPDAIPRLARMALGEAAWLASVAEQQTESTSRFRALEDARRKLEPEE